MPSCHEVLVVGGGPAGAAVAIRLARRGRDVLLIDRARFPRDKSCSEYGSPATVAELGALGLGPALEASPWTRLGGSTVTAARGARLAGRFADVAPARRARGLALPRRTLDAMLLDAVQRAGVTVREDTQLTDLSTTGPLREATLRSAGGHATVRARLVVGADGLQSRVASLAGLRRHGWLRRVAFVAHVRGVTGLGDAAELHVGRRGYVGLNPLEDDLANVALVMPATRAAAMRGALLERLAAGLADFPALAGRLSLDALAGPVRAIGPFDARCRRSVADGTLLVGDAAEFFDPFTGEGICSALIGARLAAPVIDAALDRAGPVRRGDLAAYRRARLAAFAGKWAVERMIGYAMLQPALFDRAVDRIARRGLASTLVGVTGHLLPARRVLNPRFLWRVVT